MAKVRRFKGNGYTTFKIHISDSTDTFSCMDKEITFQNSMIDGLTQKELEDLIIECTKDDLCFDIEE